MVFLNLKESPKGLLSGPVCVNYSSEIPELMIWHRKMRRRGEAVEVKELLSRNLKLSSQGLSCFSPPSPSYTHPIKESCPYYKSIGPFLSVDSLTLSFRLGESWGKAWNSASSATAMLRRSTAAVAEQPTTAKSSRLLCSSRNNFQFHSQYLTSFTPSYLDILPYCAVSTIFQCQLTASAVLQPPGKMGADLLNAP